MKTLLKNCKVIDTKKKTSDEKDILIVDGYVQEVEKNIILEVERAIDAKGLWAAPGFFDLHTHAREPGYEEAETVRTCSEAAIGGGFTAISPMPNTHPACDSQAQVRFIKQKKERVKLFPVGAITLGRKGKDLTEMSDLKNAGVKAISDDGRGVADPDVLRRAMEYASMLDLLVISHCEDVSLAAGGIMNEGAYSARLGLAPMPAEAESVMVARDIQLAELTGCRLHIAHISSAKSVELVEIAKKRSLKVTCEVTPHHFSLTEKELSGYDSVYKVNPPLRSEKDLLAIKEALRTGVIDAIATDHAPHLASRKEKEFEYAPFGMIGLQTAFSVGYESLVKGGILTCEELIAKMTSAPAGILGLDKKYGRIERGRKADITLFDTAAEWTYEESNNFSRSGNSPFLGKTLPGKIMQVFADGKSVLENGKLVRQWTRESTISMRR